MSSILKALKKLENEKNARTPDALKINAEILRGGDSARFSPLGFVLAALLLFLCGGMAVYFFMKPDSTRVASLSSPAQVPRTAPGAVVPAAPALPSPQTTTVGTPRQAPEALTQLVDTPQIRSAGTSLPTAVKAAQTKPHRQVNAAKRPPAPAASHQAEQSEIAIVPARPVVRVNGIAYQDGSDSVAVINGVAVSRGALIEGVKVEEIQRDRVQFSYSGEKFEVHLGKSNQ